MKQSIATAFLFLLISGCNKGADSHDAKRADSMAQPGYAEANLICTQCHDLPSPDQYHPAAWPSIVKRMEGYMQANNKMMPDEKQQAAILSYLQNSGR